MRTDCEFMTSRCEKRSVSGGRNTIHLLWSLNQTDRCVPMIHGAPALQLKPQRIFTRTHSCTTCATANSNMMRFRPAAQYVSASSINNGHALFCFYGLYFIFWYITLSIWCVLCLPDCVLAHMFPTSFPDTYLRRNLSAALVWMFLLQS